MIDFIKESYEVIDILKSKGYLAYLVGGCVRDYLLKIKPSDYDITTNALPEEILDVFSFTKTIKTGIKHGTVTVIYKHIPFEITTFRKEAEYLDNRHPKTVSFIDNLKGDLERRDFTINALAYDNKIYDFFNGEEDLKNGIIRAVGNPKIRFEEDALRILRAIRFQLRLKFKVEENTLNEIHNQKERLKNISIERIMSELSLILSYNSYQFVDEYFDLLMVIFPFIKENLKYEILKDVSYYDNSYILVLSRIFRVLDKENRKEIIKKYHLKNDIVRVVDLVNTSNLIVDKSIIELKKILKKNSFNDIILYIRFNYLNDFERNELLTLLKEANQECHDLKMLQIKGNDLINLGISDGIKIKETLNSLLDLVIEGKLPNNLEELINYVKKHN